MSRKAAGPPTLSIWWMFAWGRRKRRKRRKRGTWSGSRTQQGWSGETSRLGSTRSARKSSPNLSFSLICPEFFIRSGSTEVRWASWGEMRWGGKVERRGEVGWGGDPDPAYLPTFLV